MTSTIVPPPPLALNLTVYSAGAALAIVIDSSFVLLPALLVALTVNLAVPSAVGVPLISPVFPSSFRPSGRLPLLMLHATGSVPSAVRVWLYASPTLPSGSLSVVMVTSKMPGANCAVSLVTSAGTLLPDA